MELRHLRYFVAVAEELSFRRAAERINVTQPSLSEQVRQLEGEIGARLLERDTHHVSLTAAGRSFLESCRRVLREVEDGTRMANRIARGEAGRLSIGFVASLGHALLPAVLRAYREKFPDVELQLHELDTTQQIDALNAHQLDIGFIGLGLPTQEITDLQLDTLREEPLVAVLPKGHALLRHAERAESEPGANDRSRRRIEMLPLSALAKERFLLGARHNAPVYNPWLIVLCQQAGFQPHIVQEAGQPVTVLNYVAAGLGVTILPAQFSRLYSVGLRFIPLAPPVPKYRYCAAWSPQNTHSALVHFRETAQIVARRMK
ncbi:MAG: LysR substrate-binding domain-containing protein [Candidatus Methylacidiphilales bacterium]